MSSLALQPDQPVRLVEHALAEVLFAAYELRATGRLLVATAEGRSSVWLREGYPVAVELARGGMRLGDLLREAGLVDDTVLTRALSGEGRVGETLMQLGVLDGEQLKQVLKNQVRRRLVHLLSVEQGEAQLAQGDHPHGLQDGEPMRVHPRRAIYLGVRAWSAERVARRLGRLAGRRLRLAATAEVIGRYGFSPPDAAVVAAMGERAWTVDELVAATRDVTATCAVLVALALTETLALEEAGATGGPVAPLGAVDAGPVAARPSPIRQTGSYPRPTVAPPRVGTRVAGAASGATTPPRPASTAVTPAAGLPPRPASTAAGASTDAAPRPASPAGSAAASIPPRPSAANAAPPLAGPPRPAAPPRPASALPGPAPSGAPPRPAPSDAPPRPAPSDAPPRPAPSAAPPRPAPSGAPPRPAPNAAPARPVAANAAPGVAAGAEAAANPGPPPLARQRARLPDKELLRRSIEEKARQLDGATLFEILGVPESADRAAIKRAYIDAAKLFHPDRAAAVGLGDLAADAARIFRRLTEAHATLGDERRRADYLALLHGGVAAADGDALARRLIEAEMAFLRADALVKQGQFATAVGEAQRAVELAPDEGEHLALYAWAELGARQIGAAEVRPLLDAALAKSPRCARAHYYLGVVRRDGGDLDGAESSLRKALELDPRLQDAERELRVIAMRRRKK